MEEQRTNEYLIRELERVQNELNRTQEIARLGSWFWDLESGTIHWSKETYRLFGVSSDRFIPTLEAIYAMVHPEDQPAMEEAVEEALRYGHPYEMEHRVLREDGGMVYLFSKGEVDRDENGRPKTMYGTVQEISEQIETQQALAGINKKLRQYVDIVDEYVLITSTDLDGNITSASDAFCRVSGYHRDELIGKNHRIVRHPEMPRTFFKEMWDALAEGKSWEGEVKNRTKNGDTFWARMVAFPLLDEKGEKIGYSAIRHDITDKKRLEELNTTLERRVLERTKALQLLNEQLEETQRIAKMGSWEYDYLLDAMSGSRIGYVVDGLDDGEAVPLARFLRFVHPEDREALRQTFDRWRETRNGGTADFRFKNGEKVTYIHTIVQVEVDLEGQVSKVYGSSQDLTEQRLAEQRQKRQEELLALQNRQAQMGEMVNSIIHQWKQPITSISLAAADILDAQEFGELDAAYLEESVRAIQEQLDHMVSTADDFRNFFRPKSTPQAFSLLENVEKVLSMVGKAYEKEKIRIETDGDETVTVRGFPNEFSQVLLNLFSNAKDAMNERSTENRQIRVRVFREGDDAAISVTDNAGGIPEPYLATLFNPYVTSKGESGGTGIGLHMSKTIVEKMGGTIRCENVENGARFVMTFP